MERKIELTAKRSMEVRKIFAMLELWKYEKRPDMAILLKKLGEDELRYLSDGEKDNLRRYFQYLGLMSSSKTINSLGRQLISNKIMKVPERGIYKLYYIEDPLAGTRVLDYKEVDARDKQNDLEVHGKIETFEDFKEIEGKDFKRMFNKDERFSLEFVKNGGGSPSVALEESTSGEVSIVYNGGESSALWELNVSVDKKRRKLSGETDINLARNLSSWFNDFSKTEMAMAMSFEDAKKNIRVLEKFDKREKIKAEIDFEGLEDTNEWEISLKIPVVPKKEEDAEKWIEHLMKKEIPPSKYIPKTFVERKYTEIMENSTIPDAMPDWYFSLDSFVENLKNTSRDTYYRIKATEDLFVDYFMATTPPEDWKKKIILVDGSNIAWNHKDKKKGGKPLAKNIGLMMEYLKNNKGFEKVVVFCDANLKYLVDDRKKYDELVQAGTLHPVPSRTIADYFLIDYAQRYGAYIVTGDKFRDWKEDARKFGWARAEIETRDFKITGGEVVVYNLEVE